MSDRPTKREMDQAKLAGMSARQNGRGIDKCPLYSMGERGQILADEWRDGWHEVNNAAGRARR